MSEENKTSDTSNSPIYLPNLKKQELLEIIEALNEQVSALQAEIARLKSSSLIERIEISKEEEIALAQLERLKKSTENRAMSLEEARIFDILVKNKRLAQGDSTTISADYKNLNNADNQTLLSIAKKKSKK